MESLQVPNGLGASTSTTSLGHSVIHKMPSSATIGLDEDEDLVFDSPNDQVAYYRDKYRLAADLLNETRAELDEFQLSSRELEQELEKELEATEEKQAELHERIKRIEAVKDEWMNKHVNLQKMHSSTVAAMQREMDNLRSERDKTLVALRDLEMGNDELERNERVAVSSLLDMEIKYNRAIEEKTLLEQDVITHQELEAECQRLKDDVRDANNEISILRDQIAHAVLPTPPSSVMSAPDTEPLSLPELPDNESFTTPTAQSFAHSSTAEQSFALSASAAQSFAHTSNGIRSSPRGLTRSSTIASMGPSPSTKRYSAHLTSSPSGIPSLSRSTTIRNLSSAAGLSPAPRAPASPAPRAPLSPASRRAPGYPSAPALARAAGSSSSSSHQTAKTKGFKLLQDLQARIKASEDRIGNKMARRNVSAPTPPVPHLASSRRGAPTPAQASSSSNPTSRAQPLGYNVSTPGPGDRSATLLSPSSWVILSDAEDTPPAPPPRDRDARDPLASSTRNPLGFSMREPSAFSTRDDPASPLQLNSSRNGSRAVSAASGRSSRALPTRPGIPSPLANYSLSKSTSARPTVSSLAKSTSTRTPMSPEPASTSRPVSALAASTSTLRPSSRAGVARPPSRAGGALSPTHIPTPRRSSLHAHAHAHAHTPAALMAAVERERERERAVSPLPPSRPSSRASSSRPPSRLDRDHRDDHRDHRDRDRTHVRTQHGGLGRGPPPSLPTPIPTATSTTTTPFRRSSRRSSLGVNEANLPPSAIPAPKSSGSSGSTNTPSRPVSVHIFAHHTPPPPVPRIPSAILREAKKEKRTVNGTAEV